MTNTEWQISGDNILLFLFYSKESETGGMSGGCSMVIGSEKIQTDIMNQKKVMWTKATKVYNIGKYAE